MKSCSIAFISTTIPEFRPNPKVDAFSDFLDLKLENHTRGELLKEFNPADWCHSLNEPFSLEKKC